METSKPVLAGVILQGLILGPLFFLIYINDLPNKLKTSAKLFADDTSFTTVKDINKITNALNNDLPLISNWTFNWKMVFNPEPNKPAQEVLFSIKKKLPIHLTISLNNIQVDTDSYRKQIPILLDKKLNFKQHIDNDIMKVN